jgi:uncharacterized protein
LIAYFDTSAGSAETARIWTSASRVVSSVLVYPEARAALKRARRARRLTNATLRLAVLGFERLWNRMERIVVSSDLAMRAGALAHAHDLRGYDAMHLAAAETVAAPDTVFVAADGDLCTAAARLGIAVARLP